MYRKLGSKRALATTFRARRPPAFGFRKAVRMIQMQKKFIAKLKAKLAARKRIQSVKRSKIGSRYYGNKRVSRFGSNW